MMLSCFQSATGWDQDPKMWGQGDQGVMGTIVTYEIKTGMFISLWVHQQMLQAPNDPSHMNRNKTERRNVFLQHISEDGYTSFHVSFCLIGDMFAK